MKQRKILTCEQVAQVLGLSPEMVHRWGKKGLIKPSLTAQGDFIFDLNEIRNVATLFNPIETSANQEKNRFLIIDDDLEHIKALMGALEKWQLVDFKVANDSTKIDSILKHYSPHVILVNLMMPGLDGFGVCRIIKNNPDMKHIIVIIMTDFFDAENRQKANAAGANFCIEKPIKLSTLKNISQLNETKIDRTYKAPKPEVHSHQDNKDSDTGNTPSEKEEKNKNLLDNLFIPPPPKLIQEIKQTGGDLSKVATVVKDDPGVAIKILQTVNSSAFGLKVNIASIPHAVSLLGLDYIMNIIKTILLRQISSNVKSDKLDTFWSISHDIGVYAAFLSNKLSLGTADDAYTLGLFHNCGIPLLLQQHDNYFDVLEQAYANEESLIDSVEQDFLNYTHSEVGYLVSKAWHLPEHIINTIRYHHNIDYIKKILATGDTSQNPNTVKMADNFVILKMVEHFSELSFILGNQAKDYQWELIKQDIFNYANITQDDLDSLQEEIDQSCANR